MKTTLYGKERPEVPAGGCVCICQCWCACQIGQVLADGELQSGISTFNQAGSRADMFDTCGCGCVCGPETSFSNSVDLRQEVLV